MGNPVLTSAERSRVVGIVAQLPDFEDARERMELARAANLGQFIAQVQWEGTADAVAGAFVALLDGAGFLPQLPAYHALGALLAYLLNHPSPTADDKRFMATLIVTHQLIKDKPYIQRLREQYALPQPHAGFGMAFALPQPPAPVVPAPAFAAAVQDEAGLEALLGSEDNFLDVYTLLAAIYAGQAVGRIELPEGNPVGTGWLIGPDLLMTNQHVLPSKDVAADAVVRFGYLRDSIGVQVEPGRTYTLDPDCFYASPPEELDYALVRLSDAPLKAMATTDAEQGLSTLELIRRGKHRGYLIAMPRAILNLSRVNIVQHPEGDPLKAVVTQNRVVADMDPVKKRVHYRADTKPGSSGSPVFNINWEVVALHHSGQPYPPEPAGAPAAKDVRFGMNEGIPMKYILEDFKTRQTESGQPLMSLLPQVA